MICIIDKRYYDCYLGPKAELMHIGSTSMVSLLPIILSIIQTNSINFSPWFTSHAVPHPNQMAEEKRWFPLESNPNLLNP